MKRSVIIIALTLIAVNNMCGMQSIEFDEIYNRYRNVDSDTLSLMGRDCINRNSNDSALAIFTIIANRYDADNKDVDRKHAVEARLCLGVLNFLKANYAAAYSNFLTSTQIEGRQDSPGYLNISAIYLFYGDKQRAYRCLKRVFDAAVKSGNFYMASASVLNILKSNFDTSIVPDDSLRNIINVYRQKVPRTENDNVWPLARCFAEAEIHSLNGDNSKAVSILRSSLDLGRNMLMPKRELFASYSALGKKYAQMQMPDSAEYFFKMGEEVAVANGYPELLISIYTDLSDFYVATGRKMLADEYKYKYLEMQDSMFNAREYGNIHDLELFHEADKFEKRISEIKMEEQMRKRVVNIVVFVLIVLAIFLIILYSQNRKLRAKNKSLFDRNMEIMAKSVSEFSEVQNTCHHKEIINEDNDVKYTGSALSDETRLHIKDAIRTSMGDENVFCREGFSLRELAEQCGSNVKYVSQVLNEDMGKSFAQLLNERRIDVARRRLMDFQNYGNLTIEAVVKDLGFKSRSTFSRTFKRITGLTPSEFQRLAKEQNKQNNSEMQ